MDPVLNELSQLRDEVTSLRRETERLRAGLLEEAYEVVAAIHAKDDANLREELGDLLLQTVFHAQIAQEEGRYDFDAVAREIAEMAFSAS